MAAHLAGLLTIVLAISGMTGSDESRQNTKKGRDSGETTSSSASTCPCTQGCCEHGWIQYKDACYRPELENKKTWRRAEEYCIEQEAHLASVHCHEEDNFILHLMGNVKFRSYWLGAQRIRQGGNARWTWTDQTPFQYENFQKWPSAKENENHVAAVRWNNKGDFIWNYLDGAETRIFICKYFLV